MKTIGILGGMTWQSTSTYYTLINQAIEERLGGCNSAQVIVHSVNFAPVAEMQARGEWEAMGEMLAGNAAKLEAAGAELIILATNTMHLLADQITARLNVPFLHLIELTARRAVADGAATLGLLGTRFTMESSLYPDICAPLGVEVITPGEGDRAVVHDAIYNRLANGIIDDGDRRAYLRIIADLAGRGAGTVVLGCTEIGMLVKPEDTGGVSVIDTTRLHCREAVDAALA